MTAPEEGLPVGLQIIGRHLDDPLVLRASAAFEAAHPLEGPLAADRSSLAASSKSRTENRRRFRL